MTESEPTPIHGIVDGDHIFISCEDCNSVLIDIWKTKPSDRNTKIKVTCENEGCGGESWIHEVDGDFHIGVTENSELKSIDQNDDQSYVEIHAASKD